jgi:hypothetical protein
VATFKLPKTCTACGKAIKTQGKVCAKCKMRKYRERKKEQEHSLKVQMKTYREQEEALKARIRQLEEDLQRRGSTIVESSPAPATAAASNGSTSSPRRGSYTAPLDSRHFTEIKLDGGSPLEIERSQQLSSLQHQIQVQQHQHEKILAQQQEVLKQQQEVISIQQSVIAQQQRVISDHNLGHLVPGAAAHLLHQHLRQPTFLDHSSAAAVAALTSLSADDTATARSRQLPAQLFPYASQQTTSPVYHQLPQRLHLPSPQHQQLPLPPMTTEPERRGSSASSSSNNRMAITHLLSPTSAEMCAVSCI